MEKIDRMEAQRKERELRNQQAIEVRLLVVFVFIFGDRDFGGNVSTALKVCEC